MNIFFIMLFISEDKNWKEVWKGTL